MATVTITEEHEAIRKEVEMLLIKNLPSEANIIVKCRFSLFDKQKELKIMFSANSHEINGVREQFPQAVSLLYNIDEQELSVQHYACNGGQSIYRMPNKEDERERFLAMKSVKIPFRKPKAEKVFVLKAIEKFAQNWVITLKENKDKLMYQKYVDYEKLLK